MLLENLDISNTSIERVDHTDRENIKNITRVNAILNANKKAILYSKAINQSIGQAISIVENEGVTNFDSRERELQEVVVTGYGAKKGFDKPLPKIEFKKIRIASVVNAKFILK